MKLLRPRNWRSRVVAMMYVLTGVFILAVAVGFVSWRAPSDEPNLIVINVDMSSTTLLQVENEWESAFGEDPCWTEIGMVLYTYKGCASCHGQNGEGSSSVPSLLGVGLTSEQVRHQVRNPKGVMPAFSEVQITENELDTIDTYVVSLDPDSDYWVFSEQ